METLINELSLDGQFDSFDAFIDTLDDFLRIMKVTEDQSIPVLKKYDLYNRNVTRNDTLGDIMKIRGNDRVTRAKSLLLKTSNNPPYWEEDQIHTNLHTYRFEDTDLLNSSLAEACERDRIVISFKHNFFKDKQIKIKKDNVEIDLLNAYKFEYFLGFLYKEFSVISALEYCVHKYMNTKLSFEKFEEEYGFDQLEAHELDMIIEAFDRFADKKDWTEIYEDQSLNYKDYSPSRKKDNWFLGTVYQHMRIQKFRCGNTVVAPLRCFGFRDGDDFYILRIERDHKISDAG